MTITPQVEGEIAVHDVEAAIDRLASKNLSGDDIRRLLTAWKQLGDFLTAIRRRAA